MVTRVGINGFGRIGRQVLRAIMERHPDKVEVVAVNDLGDPQANAHLFKYDSTYGVYPGEVSATEDSIVVDGHSVKVLSERDPSKLPWGELGADIVVESRASSLTRARQRATLRAARRKSSYPLPRPARTSRLCSA